MQHKYEDCPEFRECNRLTETYFLEGDFTTWFNRHKEIAEKGYALAECQVGWAYWTGHGVPVDLNQAAYWTKRAMEHGDPDAQNNYPEIMALLSKEL